MSTFEFRLIPVMREGIQIIKMILFKEFKTFYSEKYKENDTTFPGKMTGAIIYRLFDYQVDSQDIQEPMATFIKENKDSVNSDSLVKSRKMEHLAFRLLIISAC